LPGADTIEWDLNNGASVLDVDDARGGEDTGDTSGEIELFEYLNVKELFEYLKKVLKKYGIKSMEMKASYVCIEVR
jgi:hypothetical protein